MKQNCYKNWSKKNLGRMIDILNSYNGCTTYFELYRDYYTKDELINILEFA